MWWVPGILLAWLACWASVAPAGAGDLSSADVPRGRLAIPAAAPARADSLRLLRLACAGFELAASRSVEGERWLADFDRGFWRSAGLEAVAEAGFTLERGPWRGRLLWRGALGAELPARGRILEGWVGCETPRWTARLGRRSILWTPVDAATLISPHARALDQIGGCYRSPSLPRVGGCLEAETFLGYLDDTQRTVPCPLLWGMRAGWILDGFLRVEALRTIMLGGGDRGSRLRPKDILRIFFGRGETTSASSTGPEYFPPWETDQKFAWHVTVGPTSWVRQAFGIHDAEAFWTYAGEDRFRGLAPTAPARAYGLRLHPRPGVAFTLTWIDTVDDGNLWYHHKIYLSGYTYRGVVLGHPAGGDARSIRLGLWVSGPAGTRLEMRATREERGYEFAGRGVEPGGYWNGRLCASIPVGSWRASVTIGCTMPWDGDRQLERMYERLVSLRLGWSEVPVTPEITRAEVWGIPD
jgi:hypothetical protein